ncbi:hypothetical protein [Exiguobacterium sp. MH3]|uniref:hypothetical protein n=1 Tax=Exiguobacterium sp. MH3 TaxID=1399115 RepID=UPI0003C3E1C7|nr:hypothetical protein [Exiguobacterium sp. MH3]AHA31527.1 hypothetical protein U719_14345 [Exiguobacterium sp. MH3]
MSLKKVDLEKKENLISIKNLKELYATYEKVKPMIEELKELMDKVIASNMKLELDDILASHSAFYDDLLLKAMHAEKLTYVGGQLVINVNQQERTFSLQMEAYFRNPLQEWIKKEHNVSYSLSSLISKDRKELVEIGIVKYELNAPTEREVTS